MLLFSPLDSDGGEEDDLAAACYMSWMYISHPTAAGCVPTPPASTTWSATGPWHVLCQIHHWYLHTEMYKACQNFKSSDIFLAPGSKVRSHVRLLQLLLVSKRETSAGPHNVMGGRAISSGSWWQAAAACPSLGHVGCLALHNTAGSPCSETRRVLS